MKNRGGRPRHKVSAADQSLVSGMIACGASHESVARCLGIDAKTLRKHFRTEIDTAADKANAAVGNRIFRQALTSDNPAWAIWWSKVRMGWQDSSKIQHVGAGPGGSIDINVSAVEEFEGRITRLASRLATPSADQQSS